MTDTTRLDLDAIEVRELQATIQRVRDLRDRWRNAQSLLTGSPDRVLIAFAEEIDRALVCDPKPE